MFDFSLIQKADISPAEFAALIRYADEKGNVRSVTRATAHRWIIGQVEPSDAFKAKLRKVLILIGEAINAGDLPLKLGTPRNDRKRLIAQAVLKHFRKDTD
jgi:hypothetical protein